jgi:hypothetical protein
MSRSYREGRSGSAILSNFRYDEVPDVCCLTHKVVKAGCRAVNCGCLMEGDPLEILVQPVPFEHGLAQFARSLTDGKSKAVAIGSSTTAAEGDIVPYPGRPLQFLQSDSPATIIAIVNKGIGGLEAPAERDRFRTDVIPAKPDLVIWQVGRTPSGSVESRSHRRPTSTRSAPFAKA